MRILKQDKKTVTIKLNGDKARDLLSGLLAHPELGDAAVELAKKLKAAGVKPLPPERHIRYEYAPPYHH